MCFPYTSIGYRRSRRRKYLEQFCQDLVDKWIYRGTHVLRNHDNNLFFEPGRTNSFGYQGQGTVFNRAGRAFSYREKLHIVAVPEPFSIKRDDYLLTIR